MQDELEKRLAGKLGGSLEDAVREKVASFGGLLTRKAAVRLLCGENGIGAEEAIPLSQAPLSPLPFSFRATVDRVFPAQEYRGGSGRSVRLHLSDRSGSATLVLWDGQAAQAENGELLAGDEVECRGAFFRSGEIALGRAGDIRKVGGRMVLPVSRLTHGLCHAEGKVGEVELDYHYVDRKSGEKKALSSFLLCEGEACRRVVAWPGKEGAPRPAEGDSVVLENVVFKNGELHFNSYSRMVVRKAAGRLEGELREVRVNGENAVFGIGGAEFTVPLPEALGLLGIREIPQGVSMATLAGIAGEGWKGKRARYSLQGGKLSWLSLG